MREYAQLNGVQFGGDLGPRSLADRYPRVAARRDRRVAIRLDQKSAQAVHYDRRSVNRVAGRQRAQLVHFGLLVTVLEIDHGGLILLEKEIEIFVCLTFHGCSYSTLTFLPFRTSAARWMKVKLDLPRYLFSPYPLFSRRLPRSFDWAW